MKVHMIVMDEHPVSVMYKRSVEQSWKDHKLILFDAVTPKDLYKKHKLDFGIKNVKPDKKREFTDTEKAVWYSHFELWCKCFTSKEPMIIIEHDSKLIRPLPDLSKEGYKFLSFVIREWDNDQTKHLAPGSGYYITPHRAAQLISLAVAREIDTNSDGHIIDVFRTGFKKQMNDPDSFSYIEQISIDGLNTIDHRKKYKNYVGLDYENIDIPSIHG